MQYRSRHTRFLALSNSQLILTLGTVLTIFMSVVLIKAIQENRGIQTRLDKLKTSLTEEQARQDELKQLDAYTQTDLFVEEEARNRLNLKKEDEIVVSLPPEKVDVRNLVEAEHAALNESRSKITPLKWWDYFFAGSN